jgi:hypothetical protein
MARLGKQNFSSYHRPIARRLPTNSSRAGTSDTPDKKQKIYGRPVVKVNHGIVEKILLVLLAVCGLLVVILELR